MILYKFGDIVINHSAGDGNPQKRGVVVRTYNRTGRVLNPGRVVECTDMRGDFWNYAGPSEKLEVVGSVLAATGQETGACTCRATSEDPKVHRFDCSYTKKDSQ